MSNVILGSYYDEQGKARPETLIVSFFNQTLRIRLEVGARASFVIPFRPVAELIKTGRQLSVGRPEEITIMGHYSSLQNDLNVTRGEIMVRYQANGEYEMIGFAAPCCGRIEVRLDRLIPYMDASVKHMLTND